MTKQTGTVVTEFNKILATAACKACGGRGVVPCNKCGGAGRDKHSRDGKCDYCVGSGDQPCPKCRR